jgi:DNA-binding CsgD family transcriptional regulator
VLRGTASQHQSTTRYIGLSWPPANTRRHGQASRDPTASTAGTDSSRLAHTTQARRVGTRRNPVQCKRLRDGGGKVATTAGARRAQVAVRLTPAERDVVRLVSEGLGNKDIATRLFVSPRTVQTHLTHVYTKLGLTSRVQLVQEAARHA